MGRPLRIEYPGALYHVTSRGNEKRKIFLQDSDRLRFKEFPNAKDIIRAVARVFRVRVEALNGKRQRGNQARKVAVCLVKRYSGLDNGRIGELFGGIHYSTVSKVAATLEQELAEDQRLTKLVETVKSQIKA